MTKFSKLSENAGATQLLNQAALPSSTELLSRFVFWVAWVGFILLGVSVLGDRRFARVHRAFLSLPASVVCGSGHSLFRIAGGQFLLPRGPAGSRQCELPVFATVEYFHPDPSSASLRCPWCSKCWELRSETMLIAFGTGFGAVMLGLAIAFGIGGKDLAREFLEKRLAQERKRRRRMSYRPCSF